MQIKEQFDEILDDFSPLEQAHWNTHLHFVPSRSLDLDNWLADALNGKKALAIDSFQQIREIGYLGNPATFAGTYIHYLSQYVLYSFLPDCTDKRYIMQYNSCILFQI